MSLFVLSPFRAFVLEFLFKERTRPMQLNTVDHPSINGAHRRAGGRKPADPAATGASSGPAAPESSRPNDRDEHGRFVKGNSGGPGNPFARRTAALRQAFSEAISEDDLKTLAKRLLVQAQNGDVAAAKLVLAYAIGKPVDPVNPDTLDIEELQLFNQFPVSAPDFQRIINNVPVGFTCQLLRILVQNAEHQAKLRMAQKFDQDTKKEERRQKRRAARKAARADVPPDQAPAPQTENAAAGEKRRAPEECSPPPSTNATNGHAAVARSPSQPPSPIGPNGQTPGNPSLNHPPSGNDANGKGKVRGRQQPPPSKPRRTPPPSCSSPTRAEEVQRGVSPPNVGEGPPWPPPLKQS
jgi:hypothetical protein